MRNGTSFERRPIVALVTLALFRAGALHAQQAAPAR